jgi:hypothetical protein
MHSSFSRRAAEHSLSGRPQSAQEVTQELRQQDFHYADNGLADDAETNVAHM